MLAAEMFTGDADLKSVAAGATITAPGLGLWPDVIVDQHFLTRQRGNRLISAVLDHPALVGVGIDEGTAVIVRGTAIEAIGKSAVIVIDPRHATVAPSPSDQPGRGRHRPGVSHPAIGNDPGSRAAVTFADALGRLETGLRAALPGPQAQDRLAPIPRRQWPAGLNPARARNAAGLLLVFPKRPEETAETAETAEQGFSLRSLRSPRFLPDRAHVILTVRADGLRHGGQVSLPGGVIDPGETYEQAALREAHQKKIGARAGCDSAGAGSADAGRHSGQRLSPLHPIVAVHA